MVLISGNSYDMVVKVPIDTTGMEVKILFGDSCGQVIYECSLENGMQQIEDKVYMVRLSPETTSGFNGRIGIWAVVKSDDGTYVKESNNKVYVNFRRTK
jgi:hypothetical protein